MLLTRWAPVACALLLAQGAWAQTAFEATYEVHAGGLRAGEVHTRVEIGEDAYRTRLDVETAGVVGWLLDIVSEVEAEGRVDNGRLVPESYRAETVQGDEERTTRITFAPDGEVQSLELVPEPDEQVPEQYRRAPDPITALLQMTRSVREADGAGEHELTNFGGIRAGAFTVRCDQRDRVSHGLDLPEDALLCTVDGEQLAGPERAGFPSIEDLGEVWLVEAAGTLVPVRARSPTDFSTVIISITGFEQARR